MIMTSGPNNSISCQDKTDNFFPLSHLPNQKLTPSYDLHQLLPGPGAGVIALNESSVTQTVFHLVDRDVTSGQVIPLADCETAK